MKNVQELVKKAKSNIQEVDIDEFRKNYKEPDIVIDVREPAEFASGHIPDAINIPRGVLEFQIDNHPVVKERVFDDLRNHSIYLYCQTGGRSALAANSLKSIGFKKVVSVNGGFGDWINAGLAVQKL